ncbi:helix-turn-helix domain-containing protein [Paracoccus sp. S4493]|uniref:helix-turn-helix transcriptional regulator n=1 Tax=Paracoccus sp. S4493 TaxID=579490 RepID=UPI0009FD9D1B|nr:helix-turn-helix domain-containing protein [Paracoccus sp. S4493]
MTAQYEHADPLLTDKEGCAILGIAKPTWWRWVRDGIIPKPVKLGSLSRWPRSEILAVIENAKAARKAAA